jgi:hypothetical protein
MVVASGNEFDQLAYADNVDTGTVRLLALSLGGSVTGVNVGAIAVGTWT